MKLIVHTSNPQTLLDSMHERGSSWYRKADRDNYEVIYFATSRAIFFEGPLTEEELQRIKVEAREAKTIKIDEFNNQITIKE